jgi:hypothetical protein
VGKGERYGAAFVFPGYGLLVGAEAKVGNDAAKKAMLARCYSSY